MRLCVHIVVADECDIMMIPTVRSTWAPVGRIPIVRHYYRRDRISVLGVVVDESQTPAVGTLRSESSDECLSGVSL